MTASGLQGKLWTEDGELHLYHPEKTALGSKTKPHLAEVIQTKRGNYSRPQNVAGQKSCPQAKAGRGVTWMTMEDAEGFRGGTWLCPCHSCLMPMKDPDIPSFSEWLCLWLPTLSPLYCYEQWDQEHIFSEGNFKISSANRGSLTLKECVPVKTVLFLVLINGIHFNACEVQPTNKDPFYSEYDCMGF